MRTLFRKQVQDFNILTFSADKADATVGIIGDIDYQEDKILFILRLQDRHYPICLPLIGRHSDECFGCEHMWISAWFK